MFDNKRKQLARQAAIKAQRIRTRYKISLTDPLNPIDIAEKCDCEVRFLSLPSLEGTYAPHPRPVIVLGSERPYGRRSFNCAHELGHHLFKHGFRFEELDNQKSIAHKLPEEYMADMFAGFLLMPQFAVNKTLKDRGWVNSELEQEHIYKLASYFGVGYSTIVLHFTWTLRIIDPNTAKKLLKLPPKILKSKYNTTPENEIFFVDEFWHSRSVDLEIGDTLILPQDINVESEGFLIEANKIDSMKTFQAIKTGYLRAFNDSSDWMINIRIAKKQYEGLAQFRFLESDEEDIE